MRYFFEFQCVKLPDYRNFYDLASAKVAIRFCKVKGHTGVTYNEKADQLAKQALGL